MLLEKEAKNRQLDPQFPFQHPLIRKIGKSSL
jgi:hypothetical protein